MDVQKIYDAQKRLAGHVKRTPITKAANIDGDIYLKMEILQDTGSFKIRGAFNKIATLTEEEAKKGVIACSAGNHAQGVAKSATERGIRSIICMPYHAPIAKVEATKRYGAEVVLVKDSFDDAAARCAQMVEEEGYTFIPPFNDEEIIAGQGTIGLEIMEDLPDVDIIVAPIGGGGLISGVAMAAKAKNPKVKVVGVQTRINPGMYESVVAGKVVTVPGGATIADGIAVKTPGDITFDIVRNYVDEIVLVTEGEISSAILSLMENDKVIAEGAGASTLAAVLYNKFNYRDKKVCCVLSGGNIDVTRISKVIDKGLYKTKRSMQLTVQLNDVPGEMGKLTKLLEANSANIMTIDQRVDIQTESIDGMLVSLMISTRDEEHQNQIITALNQAGYHYKTR